MKFINFWKEYSCGTFLEKKKLLDAIPDTVFIEWYFFLSQSNLFALNPGGTQLSSDEIPLPLIYTVINLVWATLMAAWFFNWVIYFKVGTLLKFCLLKYCNAN